MTIRLAEVPFDGPLADRLSAGPAAGLAVYWLGQAGFVVDISGLRIVIDPYLSDSLAEKYRGARFPHERMMPAPIAPSALTGVDIVLSTHAHTDHMDPGTLPGLLAVNPQAKLVAPRAAVEEARRRSGAEESRLILVDAGEAVDLGRSVRLHVTRAAHEELARDAVGDHHFLGYLVDGAGCRLWHSGDSVPFDGLIEEIAALRPDIALLPVNGRRPDLAAAGIAGNFSIPEAAGLCRAAGIPTMVTHHYGLFAFNTAAPDAIDTAARMSTTPRILRARAATALIRDDHSAHGP